MKANSVIVATGAGSDGGVPGEYDYEVVVSARATCDGFVS